MQGKTVLIVDDDAHVRQLIARAFAKAGVGVQMAENGQEGLRKFYAHRPDLVILDLMMPTMDGWETCHRIRQLCDVPIIMLTAIVGEDDVVQGLDCGAVDYITKPFSPKVLLARSRAALRQRGLATDVKKAQTYSDGYLTIDLEQGRVWVDTEPVRLTKTEWRLLRYLFQGGGRVLTYRQILEHVWGWEYQDSLEYVHNYVAKLRRKLERDRRQPRYLVTEHGIGYRFEK